MMHGVVIDGLLVNEMPEAKLAPRLPRLQPRSCTVAAAFVRAHLSAPGRKPGVTSMTMRRGLHPTSAEKRGRCETPSEERQR
jgi:hypothetical protein